MNEVGKIPLKFSDWKLGKTKELELFLSQTGRQTWIRV